MRFLIFLFFLVLAFPLAARAEDVPDKSSLSKLEKTLSEKEKEKGLISKQIKALEGQLTDTKKDLVKVARSVQKSEAQLSEFEKRIAENEKQQAELQESLAKDRDKIAGLIVALERIRRVPPEALIARPGAPLKTAQSAMLMGDIIPSLNRNAENLKKKIDALSVISNELKEDRRKVLETSKALQEEQVKLSMLVDKRESLYSETREDYKEQEQAAQAISRKASNLRDLIQKLDAEKAQQAEAAKAAKKIAHTSAKMPKAGSARLPVPGVVAIGYGDSDDLGAASKGLSIEARAGALVVAPFGGIVRFAGPFKRYGNMVIIEHDGGFHSLIAGLEKIDTVVGQSVSAGEPLGVLSGGSKPVLYYELRQNGQPVDPSTRIAGLG